MQWVVMSARVALGMGMSFIESNELNVMSCIDWDWVALSAKVALEWVAQSARVAFEMSFIESNELLQNESHQVQELLWK